MLTKKLFFQLFIKPIIFLISGTSVTGKENIPRDKPFIIVANHNSHLDALVILSLFSGDELVNISPVAAADYFFKNKYLRWISLNLIGITPINRESKIGLHPLAEVYNSIEAGKSLIIFPEGSRGKPEQLQKFKSGIGHIVKKYPNIPVLPVVLANTGKALPKNEALFVPLIIKITIKPAINFAEENLSIKAFVEKLEDNFKEEQHD